MTDGGPELPIVKHPASSSHDDSGAFLLLTDIVGLPVILYLNFFCILPVNISDTVRDSQTKIHNGFKLDTPDRLPIEQASIQDPCPRIWCLPSMLNTTKQYCGRSAIDMELVSRPYMHSIMYHRSQVWLPSH